MKTIKLKSFNPLSILMGTIPEWNQWCKENPWGFIIETPRNSYKVNREETMKKHLKINNWTITLL